MTYNNAGTELTEQLHGWWLSGVFWSDAEVRQIIFMFPGQAPQAFKKSDIRGIVTLQKALKNFLVQMPHRSPGTTATLELTPLGITLVNKYA